MLRISGSSESTHRIYLGLFTASSRSPKYELPSVARIEDGIAHKENLTVRPESP